VNIVYEFEIAGVKKVKLVTMQGFTVKIKVDFKAGTVGK